jgi:pyruvate decarboxylase
MYVDTVLSTRALTPLVRLISFFSPLRQLTVQELSVMIAHDLKPIIFLLNNSGYTIERYLHGKERYDMSFSFFLILQYLLMGVSRKYNDITNWKWTSLFNVFGDDDGKKSQTFTVHNKAELSTLLDNEKFANADKIQLVEVIMDKFDAPRALQVQAELSGKTNAYVTSSSR